MLSNFNRQSYTIQLDGELPQRLNKKRTDKVIESLTDVATMLQNVMAVLKDDDAIAMLLNHQLDWISGNGFDDNLQWRVDRLNRCLQDLREQLMHQDVIAPIEEQYSLEDLGYKRAIASNRFFYEKVLKDTGEQEQVEEIQMLKDGPVLRRLRTTDWDVYPGGRSSRQIVYKTLRMTKLLKSACENSKNQEK